jgi:hypothetical protein
MSGVSEDGKRPTAVAGPASVLGGDFSVQEAIGGWRGLVEAVAPGLVFVVAYRLFGGYVWPTVAAAVVIAAMVLVRVVRKQPITHALGGILGVGIGALWAWRAGDAREYFVPGYWMTAGLVAVLLLSVLVRWPAVGIVVGIVRGWGTRWRADRAAMRTFQAATVVYLGFQMVRLAVQLWLYDGGADADVLGTAKLILGVPYFVVSLAVIWLMVRRVELAQEPQDPPQRQG